MKTRFQTTFLPIKRTKGHRTIIEPGVFIQSELAVGKCASAAHDHPPAQRPAFDVVSGKAPAVQQHAGRFLATPRQRDEPASSAAGIRDLVLFINSPRT